MKGIGTLSGMKINKIFLKFCEDLDYYNDNENNGNNGNSTVIVIIQDKANRNSMKPNITKIYNEYMLWNFIN
ncbi:hypothetical protein H8356DRAFT_1691695 [Neocallimastix lanati (nom. inval.)]|nr:hypothetical protein H8356DRAFT_1691695 [Neocallimastix sp. JGI-2020a]